MEFLKKDGVQTHFKVNEKTERIIKRLCLFSIGVFQTDSVERRVVYKRGGQFFCSTVDELCEDYDSLENRIDLPETTHFVKIDKQGKISGFATGHEGLKNAYPDNYHWYYQDKEDADEDDLISRPGIRLRITKQTYQGDARVGEGDNKLFEPMWSFKDTDEISFFEGIEVDRIYDFKDAGYKGYCGSSITSKHAIGPAEFEERHSILDLDCFSIEVLKQTEDKYKCSFTPISPVYHAGACWGELATVDMTLSKIKVDFVHEMMIEFSEKEDGGFDVVTTYYGIDRL